MEELSLKERPGVNQPSLRLLRDERQRLQAALKDVKLQLGALETHIHEIVQPEIAEARAELQKNEGTVRAVVDGMEVKHEIPVHYEWDQEVLEQAMRKLREAGYDLKRIVDVKFSIKKSILDGLPEMVQDMLKPAMTTKHRPAKIEIYEVKS